ncbi:MAG: winged helix-turn-helix domain-containing protein [Acidobacteria bacterium]|nr:winged helix-turn-helix domain-containing protein [Acidobacteriota bacterium]
MDFRIGPWLVRSSLNCIVRDGRVHSVTPRSMDVLVFLANRHGEVCSKREIFEVVWRGAFVTDDALTRCIGELRRVFGETGQQASILVTVAKRGYRIAPAVTPEPANTLAPQWGGSSARARSMVVLPLLNLSGDPGQEYFSDGMTEILTSNLSKVGSLRVISRTSAMTYKGSPKQLREIAGELNVELVVEGSVVRSGRRVRIVAQLIDAATDTHLWTETFDRNWEDVLSLQAELAEAIVRNVSVVVTPEEKARLTYGPRIRSQAYEAYLKGTFHLNKSTPEGFRLGLAYLEQAVADDPSDPFAHASLALGFAIMGHERFPDASLKAKAAALRSLTLGGPVAEAVAALGMAELYWDWDLDAAGRDLERALELKPNFAEVLRNYSWYLRLRGRPREALSVMRQAQQLEPLVPLFSADLAWQCYEEGEWEEALLEAAKSIELDPDFAEGLAVAGWVLTEQGRIEEALPFHRRAAADPSWKWPLGRTLALMGQPDEAKKIAAQLQDSPGPMEHWGLAVVYSALGENDLAFHWLETAYRSRFSWMPWLSDFSLRPLDLFTPLRDHPQFLEMIAKVGIPTRNHC